MQEADEMLGKFFNDERAECEACGGKLHAADP